MLATKILKEADDTVVELDKTALFQDLAGVQSNLSDSLAKLYTYKEQYISNPNWKASLTSLRAGVADLISKMASTMSMISLENEGKQQVEESKKKVSKIKEAVEQDIQPGQVSGINTMPADNITANPQQLYSVQLPFNNQTLYLGINEKKMLDFITDNTHAIKTTKDKLMTYLKKYFIKKGNDWYTGNGTKAYPKAKNIKVNIINAQ